MSLSSGESNKTEPAAAWRCRGFKPPATDDPWAEAHGGGRSERPGVRRASSGFGLLDVGFSPRQDASRGFQPPALVRDARASGRKCGWVVGVIFSVAALAFAAAATAAEPFAPTPLEPGLPLSLEQAVQGALAGDAAVLAALETVHGREGALEEARGLFDRSYRLDGRVDYTVEELFGGRLRGEKDRRLRLEIPPPILDDTAQALINRLPTSGSLLFSQCEQAQSFFSIQQEDGSLLILCFDQNGDFTGFLGSGLDPSTLDAVNLARAFSDLANINARLDEFIQVFLNIAADEFRTIAFVLRRTADSLRFQRVRIGRLPTDREAITMDLGFDYRYPLRNGARIVSTLGLVSTEDNFRGKPLSPAFGDSFAPNTFTSTLGVALDWPLGKGGGKVAAQASERAAEVSLAAARDLLAQTASDRALAAVEAYFDLAAATRRLELLGQSVAAQDRILSSSEELVKGEVIAGIELKRTAARRSQVASDYVAARQAVIAARFALQKVMGRSAGALAETPEASESLATWAEVTPAADAAAEALTARALDARRDVRANAAIVEANEIFRAAAEHDLRPELNLALNVSFNGLFESFKDRFYDLEGFQRAFDGKIAGPSYGLALRFKVPFRNNAARGRLLQAEASVAQAEIDAAELRRDIGRRVAELQAALGHAAAQVRALRETLGHQEETHAASGERFAAGDLTLIDTLTTEEQLTATRLQLLDAERRYLALVARLRYETGTLLDAPASEAFQPATARLRPLGQPIL
jgi:outer membrane protein